MELKPITSGFVSVSRCKVKCLDHSALSICKESRYIDGFMPLTMTALASIAGTFRKIRVWVKTLTEFRTYEVVRKKLLNLTNEKIETAQPIRENPRSEIDLGEKVDVNSKTEQTARDKISDTVGDDLFSSLMSSGSGSAIQTAVDSSDEEIVVVKRRKKWLRNTIVITALWISECFYEIEMLSATAWLFRGRTGLKSLLCFVIIADIITFCLYQHRDNYELVSEEVSTWVLKLQSMSSEMALESERPCL